MASSAAYDPNAWYDAFRSAMAPMIRIQEDGLRTAERFARLQQTITGDWIESSLAQLHAALESRSPAQFFEKERNLAERFGDRTRSWTEEFMTITNHVREAGEDLARETFSRAAETTSRMGEAARDTSSRMGEAARDASSRMGEAGRDASSRMGEAGRGSDKEEHRGKPPHMAGKGAEKGA